MGCFHGQAIGDCLACDIDEAMREADPSVVAARLINNAASILEQRDDAVARAKRAEAALAVSCDAEVKWLAGLQAAEAALANETAKLEIARRDVRVMHDVVNRCGRERTEERAETERIRAEATASLSALAREAGEFRGAVEYYIKWNGLEHEDVDAGGESIPCPEDDTCECPLIESVNRTDRALVARLDALKAGG